MHGFEDDMALRILHPIIPIDSQYCLKPEITFRHINKNGEIKPAKVNYQIPKFNFCANNNHRFPYPHYTYTFGSENIFVLYINLTNIITASYYGLVVDKITGNYIRYIILYIFYN